MHFLRYADPGEVPKCEYNLACLSCPTCKAFRNWGICSHVVAINHILDNIDLEDTIKELSAPRAAGGFGHGVRPALVKEKEAEVDSSEEEEEPLAKRLKYPAKGPKCKGPSPPPCWMR